MSRLLSRRGPTSASFHLDGHPAYPVRIALSQSAVQVNVPVCERCLVFHKDERLQRWAPGDQSADLADSKCFDVHAFILSGHADTSGWDNDNEETAGDLGAAAVPGSRGTSGQDT
jgi:hypothetical protein